MVQLGSGLEDRPEKGSREDLWRNGSRSNHDLKFGVNEENIKRQG